MLNSKQRSYLRSLGNPLADVLQIGKDEISEAVANQADDALTARELIKVKLLQNCALDTREAAEELAAATSSEVVSVIGRKFLLYRASTEEHKIILPR